MILRELRALSLSLEKQLVPLLLEIPCSDHYRLRVGTLTKGGGSNSFWEGAGSIEGCLGEMRE